MTLQRSYADDYRCRGSTTIFWPFRIAADARRRGAGRRRWIVEMLLGGVTSFVDIYYFQVVGGGGNGWGSVRAGLQLFRYEHR